MAILHEGRIAVRLFCTFAAKPVLCFALLARLTRIVSPTTERRLMPSILLREGALTQLARVGKPKILRRGLERVAIAPRAPFD